MTGEGRAAQVPCVAVGLQQRKEFWHKDPPRPAWDRVDPTAPLLQAKPAFCKTQLVCFLSLFREETFATSSKTDRCHSEDPQGSKGGLRSDGASSLCPVDGNDVFLEGHAFACTERQADAGSMLLSDLRPGPKTLLGAPVLMASLDTTPPKTIPQRLTPFMLALHSTPSAAAGAAAAAAKLHAYRPSSSLGGP
ncbi:hypothetical protein ACSSS7_000547 [Eimeria intestinalis]